MREEHTEENLSALGAYDLISSSDADVTIFATGSEVSLAVEASEKLESKGIATRVVSVPSFELFEDQDDNYKAAILGNSKVKIAIEAGIRMGWDRFIGTDGIFIGMNSFGASGPAEELFEHFGITADAAVAAAEAKLKASA